MTCLLLIRSCRKEVVAGAADPDSMGSLVKEGGAILKIESLYKKRRLDAYYPAL
jgi:hypothetical protein